MRANFILIALLLFSSEAHAAEWSCPIEIANFQNGAWCDADHEEYKAKEADKHLNEVYRQLLSDYSYDEDKQPWKIAQRAWLKFMEAHCSAAANKNAGSGSTRQSIYSSCRTEKIIERTKELKSYCESCN